MNNNRLSLPNHLTRIVALLAALLLSWGLTGTASAQEDGQPGASLYFPAVASASGLVQPLPAMDATNQSPNMYLAWQMINPMVADPRYTIYLEATDTTPDVPIAVNLARTSFDPTTFALGTDYYWQVVAEGSNDFSAQGPVWHFRTEPLLVTPASGAMVSVPAGEFLMGCDPTTVAPFVCTNKDKPLHRVWLDAYQIDKYEVTNREYRRCVEAGRCNPPRRYDSRTRDHYYDSATYDDYPVLFVSNFDMRDYCAWAGKRAPTEAEWEKAARGPIDTRIFPWGNEFPDCTRENFTEDHYQDDVYFCVGDTTRAGAYPTGASPYGAMDMAGNAFEWVADNYDESYYSHSPYMNPINTKGGPYTIRGGSYKPRASYTRVLNRHFGHRGDGVGDDVPFYRNDQVGFRCAR